MRVMIALAALLFLATFAPPSLYAPAELPADAKLRFDPVSLNSQHPGQRQLGALRYLGGWSIRSNDPRFGGISAMHVEGRQVLAVSDRGFVICFALPAEGRASRVRIDGLEEGPGSRARASNRDAEAMAVGARHVWIGFESRNAVWRYRRPAMDGEAGARPLAMRDWPRNRGSEAMVRLADGRFLIFAEGGADSDGTTPALLFSGDPAEEGTGSTLLRYRAPDGYRITDAALLPDGRLLFLNRRIGLLNGITAKLTLGTPPMLRNDAVLAGDEIADFRPPVTVDNMEALSVTRESGRTIVWIASDDNFSPLQRTLLLKFALD